MPNVRVDSWDFGPGQLLSPGEVAEMFRVGPATVARWADEGRLSCVRTLGGVRRFSREQIEHFMNNPDSLTPPAPRNGRTVERGGEGTA